MKHHNENKQKVKEVIAYVTTSGGIEYATEKMHAFKDEALAILRSMPGSDARNSLEDLVMYTTERDR